MDIKIMNAALKIFTLEKTKKAATPEIRPVIAKSEWNLLSDKQNTNGCQHPLDHSGGKIIRNHAEFKNSKNNLKKSCNNYRQEKDTVVTIRKNRCSNKGGKASGRSGHTQLRAADERNDNPTNDS